MRRREFLELATKGAIGTALVGVVGCSTQEIAEEAASDTALPEINWEMATSWPLSLDTIYGGAVAFADTLRALTQGKFNVTPRAAGELAPGLEVLNVVEDGSVDIGHTASYYYVGKSPTVAFGTALPFGFTSRMQNGWLYEAGGLQLMQEFYRERFGVIQFPAGNTGVQMGGWFNKEINSVADIPGLRFRIPGLGGQVMSRLGASIQAIPGGEIFQALQTGAIDAAEWVGPYDDEKLDFPSVARYYYYPGWWEPGPTLEVQIGVDKYDPLPEVYKSAISAASYVANMTMMARYDAKNPAALASIAAKGIDIRPFPPDVLQAAEESAFALYDEFNQADPDFNTIYQPWLAFREQVTRWHGIAEKGMLEFLASTR